MKIRKTSIIALIGFGVLLLSFVVVLFVADAKGKEALEEAKEVGMPLLSGKGNAKSLFYNIGISTKDSVFATENGDTTIRIVDKFSISF